MHLVFCTMLIALSLTAAAQRPDPTPHRLFTRRIAPDRRVNIETLLLARQFDVQVPIGSQGRAAIECEIGDSVLHSTDLPLLTQFAPNGVVLRRIEGNELLLLYRELGFLNGIFNQGGMRLRVDVEAKQITGDAQMKLGFYEELAKALNDQPADEPIRSVIERVIQTLTASRFAFQGDILEQFTHPMITTARIYTFRFDQDVDTLFGELRLLNNWGAGNPDEGPFAYYLAYTNDGTLAALHEATCLPDAM